MAPQLSPSPRLPTVLIGGYLGAGKTTLVNQLLRQAQGSGRRVAVLVNDFGEINIDADLIDASAAAAGVLSLAGGCLCCSFGDDLVGTLNGLMQRDPAPELCLIELSGVALPGAVARTVRLALGAELVGTLVLADAGRIPAQADDRYVGDTVRQQLVDASWLLLTKRDLATPQEAAASTAALARLAPAARLLPQEAGALGIEMLQGWKDVEAQAAPSGRAWVPRPISPAPSSVAAPSPFASRSLALPDGVDLPALAHWLVDPTHGVLRAKALARVARGQDLLMQVAGGRWSVSPARVEGAGRLVLIGLRGQIEQLDLDLPTQVG